MSNYIVVSISIVVIVLVLIDRLRITEPEREKTKYKYLKKSQVMTDHELKYYRILQDAVADKYYILAQAHLSAFLDQRVKNGQNWKAAFRHINGKSIDYLLCDKTTFAPLLAIELDDKSHEQSDRRLRDEEVERIFSDADLPLMRVPSHGTTTDDALKDEILSRINQLAPK